MRTVRVRGIIPYKGKFLFVKSKRPNTHFALVGGGLDDAETLEDGLRREIVEELGVRPTIGKLLYVQQLFFVGHESLEFFFLVENGADFLHIDLAASTHGALELAAIEFIDPAEEHILPEFLADLAKDLRIANWPKVYVSNSETL